VALAAAEGAVLTASSADLVRRVARRDRRSAAALAPYPLWCAFATKLTIALARRNPSGGRAGDRMSVGRA
jgi:benzodiazapine receptor